MIEFQNDNPELDGIAQISEKGKPRDFAFVKLDEFLSDLKKLIHMVSSGPLKSFCYRRLCFLTCNYNLHVLNKEIKELYAQKQVKHRDFYNIRKVDTHVHAASCMNQKHLLRFIKRIVKNNQDDQVILDTDGKPMTLKQLCDVLNVEPYDLNVDSLDVHAVCTFQMTSCSVL